MPHTRTKWSVTSAGNVVAWESTKAHIFAKYDKTNDLAYIDWRNPDDVPLVENAVVLFDMVQEAQPIVESTYLDHVERYGQQAISTQRFYGLSERMKAVVAEIQSGSRPSSEHVTPTKRKGRNQHRKTTTSFVVKAVVEAPCGCQTLAYSGDRPPFVAPAPAEHIPCSKPGHRHPAASHWMRLEDAARTTAEAGISDFFKRLHDARKRPSADPKQQR